MASLCLLTLTMSYLCTLLLYIHVHTPTHTYTPVPTHTYTHTYTHTHCIRSHHGHRQADRLLPDHGGGPGRPQHTLALRSQPMGDGVSKTSLQTVDSSLAPAPIAYGIGTVPGRVILRAIGIRGRRGQPRKTHTYQG